MKKQLQTKADLRNLAESMISNAIAKLSPCKAWLNVGESAAKYSHKTAWMEGFLRPLFGLVPLSAGGAETELWNVYLEGIITGTNPDSPEYWGDLEGKEQKEVEMTTLGLALALVPDLVWKPLNEKAKANLESWLLQINNVELATNNWLFFPVMVNLGLKKVGAHYSREIMEEALDRIENSYLGDGWYGDGPTLQRDYYIPFAMHFYGLIYAKLMEEEDLVRACRYKERAALFAGEFICWFSKDGDALPFGRSLTYRFAMIAFWSALAFAEISVYSMGVYKGLILRNIRWWMQQPIFDAEGLLTIGYRYPNLKMAEFYNAPGSPAWAMKAFWVLALPDNHPFWFAEEEVLPKLPTISIQKHPFMILMRGEDGEHVQALTSGQHAPFEPTFMAAKYEKFIYSNVFGFSIQGGEYGLEQGAYDSMLALCEGEDNQYRVRRRCKQVDVMDTGIYSVWEPWNDVVISTWLIPCGSWHVRVHRIESSRELTGAEGAYAVNCDSYNKEDTGVCGADINESHAWYSWGCTGIVNLEGERLGCIIKAHPNTNILYSRTVIPTLTGTIKKGVTWLSCAVLGTKELKETEKEWSQCPTYKRDGECFTVNYKEKCFDFKWISI